MKRFLIDTALVMVALFVLCSLGSCILRAAGVE